PEKSLLLQAIRHEHKTLRMPKGTKLPDAVLADFTVWVKHGVTWPQTSAGNNPGLDPRKHWAFQPVKRVQPPADPTGWTTSPIDQFIMAGLKEHGLKPVAPADRRTLIRRATFDLIGLPPTPQEIDAFVKDASPDAFARVVERLLASPHYGERWGRHWIDVVRYADTAGDTPDSPIPPGRRYPD